MDRGWRSGSKDWAGNAARSKRHTSLVKKINIYILVLTLKLVITVLPRSPQQAHIA